MVDWWTEVGLFLNRHGLVAAFVYLLIEEAGVPVPVPGDVLMLVLGVRAHEGSVTLWQAVGTTWLGTMIGSSGLYFASRIAGRNLVYRYGRFMRLTPERLDKAEVWLKHHGSRAVFVGRLVPGLRIVTAVACGVFDVPFQIYFPAMSIGALLYILVYTLLGYFLGRPVLDLLDKIHIPFGLLGSLVLLGLLLLWTFRTRQALGHRVATTPRVVDRERQVRAGAAAGLLATIGSTLLMNVLIDLAGGLAFNAPGTLIERTASRLAFALAREVDPILLVAAVPVYLAVGVLWGVLYAWWAEERLPAEWADWMKGIGFAVLPLLVSTFVVMPTLGLGFLGVGATGPVALTGELIRHAAYGALLGLMYPILRARRTVKVRAHTSAELAPEQPLSA